LLLAGYMEVPSAKKLVEKNFGAIKAGPTQKPLKVDVPTLAAPKSEVMKDKVATTRIYRNWTVPGIDSADSVPLDFEIRRARTMLNDLIPEVRKNMVAIAQEEAALAQLATEIERQEKVREKETADILRLKNDLAAGGTKSLEYAGKKYTPEAVKTDLARRFERRKTSDETLENLHKMHAARERSLQAAHDKMNGMLAAKKHMELEIEQLAGRPKMAEAGQTTSSLAHGDRPVRTWVHRPGTARGSPGDRQWIDSGRELTELIDSASRTTSECRVAASGSGYRSVRVARVT